MRKRLWFSSFAVAVVAVLVVGVPALVIAARGGSRRACIAAADGRGGRAGRWLTAVLAGAARPPGRGARRGGGRLGAGRPAPARPPVRGGRPGPGGRRPGQLGAQAVSSLLAADRELTADASHQLRTPLTALSMRLEEMIAAADDPDVVREEGSAALAQAERLADVVTQLLSPARRATASRPR